MTYFEIIIATFKSLWSLRKARFAFTFKGEDFAQSEGDTPITTDHEAWLALDPIERDTLNNKKYIGVNLKSLTWDNWSLNEKKFYVELKKRNTINSEGIPLDAKVRTQSDEFLDKIRNLTISMGYLGTYNTGKYLGWLPILINVVFSPTFSRIILAASAVAMLFTPLGYGVGAVALSVAIGTVAFDIYRNTARYRQLDNIREENVLLNELKKEDAELQKTLIKTSDAFKRVVSTTMLNQSIKPNRESPSFFGAMIYTLFGNYSNMIISISLSILTLNPIAIMVSLLSTVVGYSVTTAMHYQFAKRVTYLGNANSLMLAELNLDQNFKSGSRNDFLSDRLNVMRCYNLAVAEAAQHPEASKLNPDREAIRKVLVEAFNKEISLSPEPKKNPRPSFLEDTWMLIKVGINWTNSNSKFTPSFIQADVVKNYSKEEFIANRKVQSELNQQERTKVIELQKSETIDSQISTATVNPNSQKRSASTKSHVEKLTSEKSNTQFHNP